MAELQAKTESPWKLPSRRWYCSPIVQFMPVFMALVGYQHTSWRWAWTFGGYVVGLVCMTVAYAREQMFPTPRALRDSEVAVKSETLRLALTDGMPGAVEARSKLWAHYFEEAPEFDGLAAPEKLEP